MKLLVPITTAIISLATAACAALFPGNRGRSEPPWEKSPALTQPASPAGTVPTMASPQRPDSAPTPSASPDEPAANAPLTPTPHTQSKPGEQAELLFASGFEEEQLFPEDDSLWTATQLQTAPGHADSTWARTDELAHSGTYSARFSAAPGSEATSYTCGKASIKKQNLDIGLGDTVEYRAFFYLPSLDAPVHLMDIECGPPCDQPGGPGVRVIMTRDGYLKINWKFLNYYKNMGLPLPQDAPPDSPKGTHRLPIAEWFELTLRMDLANQAQGLTEVYINGMLDLSVIGTNIAPSGLASLDQYPSLELGVNCNYKANSSQAVVYVDEVQVLRISSSP